MEGMKKKVYLHQVTEEMIEAAKATKPDTQLDQINFILDDGRVIEAIFTERSPASWQRYVSTASEKEEDSGLDASLQFIRDNIVAPTYEEFYRLVDREKLPAFPIQVANELGQGLGITKKTEKKRL